LINNYFVTSDNICEIMTTIPKIYPIGVVFPHRSIAGCIVIRYVGLFNRSLIISIIYRFPEEELKTG